MFAAQPKHQPEYTAEELRSTKLLLEHCLSYLKHHHDQNDGGLHINLIARIKDELAKPAPEPVAWLRRFQLDPDDYELAISSQFDRLAFPVYGIIQE